MGEIGISTPNKAVAIITANMIAAKHPTLRWRLLLFQPREQYGYRGERFALLMSRGGGLWFLMAPDWNTGGINVLSTYPWSHGQYNASTNYKVIFNSHKRRKK